LRVAGGLAGAHPFLLNLPVVSFYCAVGSEDIRHTKQIWRRRVGVEPTIRSAKGRIGGFEGRDSHRTIFASAWIIDHHDWASDELADLQVDLLTLID
jgi:hypothetical protein